MASGLQRVAAAAAVAFGLTASTIIPARAAPISIASVEQVAGGKLREQVYWYGWGPGWGAALATGAIVGGALGLAAAATAPINPYWYGYPAYVPAYDPYPVYYRRYRRAYWSPYGWRGYYAYTRYDSRYRRAFFAPLRLGLSSGLLPTRLLVLTPA